MGVKKDEYDNKYNGENKARWTRHRIAIFMEMIALYVQLNIHI